MLTKHTLQSTYHPAISMFVYLGYMYHLRVVCKVTSRPMERAVGRMKTLRH
jgi:hypothetical protein